MERKYGSERVSGKISNRKKKKDFDRENQNS
jgi:hypothetical protein